MTCLALEEHLRREDKDNHDAALFDVRPLSGAPDRTASGGLAGHWGRESPPE
jgi:hypothetical protein